VVAALAPPDMTGTYVLLAVALIGVLALVGLVVWAARRFRH
jgi:flagellar biogenesis protein FliO